MATTKKSQNAKILNFLQRGRNISSCSALTRFGVVNLSTRIFELREEGVAIKTNTNVIKSGLNRGTRVTSYSLLG